MKPSIISVILLFPLLSFLSAAALACDDGIACTIDFEDPLLGCVSVPSHLACDDGDACNGIEVCVADAGCFLGDAPLCDDRDPCTIDTCDASAGCSHSPLSCDDSNPCTLDTCEDGCRNVAAPDGSSCGSGRCHLEGVCSSGACIASPTPPRTLYAGGSSDGDCADPLLACPAERASALACDADTVVFESPLSVSNARAGPSYLLGSLSVRLTNTPPGGASLAASEVACDALACFSLTSAESAAYVTFRYPDEDSDGIVDGTSLREGYLIPYLDGSPLFLEGRDERADTLRFWTRDWGALSFGPAATVRAESLAPPVLAAGERSTMLRITIENSGADDWIEAVRIGYSGDDASDVERVELWYDADDDGVLGEADALIADGPFIGSLAGRDWRLAGEGVNRGVPAGSTQRLFVVFALAPSASGPVGASVSELRLHGSGEISPTGAVARSAVEPLPASPPAASAPRRSLLSFFRL